MKGNYSDRKTCCVMTVTVNDLLLDKFKTLRKQFKNFRKACLMTHVHDETDSIE